MSQNNLAYSTIQEEDSKKKETNKKRGPKFTPPQTLRSAKGSDFCSWSKSITGQLKHQRLIMEEASKCAANKNHKPNVKITKRFEGLFKESIIEAQHRANAKAKRNKRNDKQ